MVLVWELPNTIDARCCVHAVERAIAEHAVPELFNTDQGSQFTSAEFTQPLLARGVELSMDGRGRALDNVFVERLGRTVNDKEVDLRSNRSQIEADTNLDTYFRFDHGHRPHSAFGVEARRRQWRSPASQSRLPSINEALPRFTETGRLLRQTPQLLSSEPAKPSHVDPSPTT